VDACLLKYNPQINEDIELYQEQIETRNTEFEDVQNDVGKIDEGFLSESYNINEVTKNYRENQFKNFL